MWEWYRVLDLRVLLIGGDARCIIRIRPRSTTRQVEKAVVALEREVEGTRRERASLSNDFGLPPVSAMCLDSNRRITTEKTLCMRGVCPTLTLNMC